MANTNVELEGMREAASALSNYTSEVNVIISEMKKAAQACHDNLADNTFSVEAISALNEDLVAISSALEEAQNIHGKLLGKIRAIEDLQNATKGLRG